MDAAVILESFTTFSTRVYDQLASRVSLALIKDAGRKDVDRTVIPSGGNSGMAGQGDL